LNDGERALLASHAKAILTDHAFNLAMAEARSRALDELAKQDATDVDAVRNLQATVRGIERVRDALQNFVANTPRTTMKVV
jgi:predicted nucleic-acid-binding protein